METNNIDIALIQPVGWANQNPPLGLALLKSYLSRSDIHTKVFDLNIVLYNLRHGRYADLWDNSQGYYLWEKESFVKELLGYYSTETINFVYEVLSYNPKVIGFSTHCSSYVSARILAKKIKQIAPGVKIIFGGPHVASYTSNWEKLLMEDGMDGVIFGEGEETLAEYLRNDVASINDPINGMVYISNANDELMLGGDRPLVRDLNSLPNADFSDFDLKYYAGVNVLPTYFSRGCINNCIFCTERQYFPRFRNRTGQRVFDEIKYQLALYPKTEFFRLHDSLSNGNVKELEKFCDLLIEHNLNIGFNLENAVIRKEMDKPLYRKLRKAGCTLIGYGVETPSKPLLKAIGKKACQAADFDKVVSDGVAAKMTIGINMMFGLPGESENDFNQQLDFVRRHKKERKRIIINPALNYCYLPEGSHGYSNPEKYDIDMTHGELYWSMKDGTNTFVDRLERFEKFTKLASDLGYLNLFGITESVNREELLGNYFRHIGQKTKSLEHFRKSFQHESRNLELSRNIIELHDELSNENDSFYKDVLAYYKENEVLERRSWLEFINTFEELQDHLIKSTIKDTIDRLNLFIEATYEPSVKMNYSVSGVKGYMNHMLAKILYRSDRKYVMIVQVLKELDNKINLLISLKDK